MELCDSLPEIHPKMFGFLCKTLRRSATDVQNSSFLLEVASVVLVGGFSSSSKKISKPTDQ